MYLIFVSKGRAEIFFYESVDDAMRKLYKDAAGIECLHRPDNEEDLQDYIDIYNVSGHEVIDNRELVLA